MTKDKIAQRKEAWGAIAEAMPVAIAIASPADGTILYENELFLETFGLTKENSMARFQFELYYNPRDYEELIEEWRREGSVEGREVRLLRADGSQFWASVSIKSANVCAEAVIISSFADISQSKSVTDAYHRQAVSLENMFKNIFEHIYDAVVITDMQGRVEDWNSAAKKMFGYSRAEVLGKSQEILHPDSEGKSLTRKIMESIKLKGRWVGEINFIRRDGSAGVCETRVVPMVDRGGLMVGTIAVNRDISEQKRSQAAENQLLESIQLRARLQEAVAYLGQEALMGVALSELMDKAARLLASTLNVEYSNILELQPGNHAFFVRSGVGWQQGIVGHATLSARNSQAGYTLRVNGPVFVKDLRVETRFSGTPLLHNHRVVSGLSVVIPNIGFRNGKLTETNGLTGDIGAAESKEAWGVLSVHTTDYRNFGRDDIYFLEAIANVLANAIERYKSDERLRLMERAIDSSSNGITIADASDADNPIIYANPSFERITGYKAEEAMGKNCRFLQGSDREQPGLEKLRQAIWYGKECQVVLRNFRKDGTEFWNELSIAPVYNAERHLTHFVGIQNDISDRKRYEEELFWKSQALANFSSSLKQVHRLTTYSHHNLEELLSDYLEVGGEIFGLSTGIVSKIEGEFYQIKALRSAVNLLDFQWEWELKDTYCQEVIKEKRTIAYGRINSKNPVAKRVFFEEFKLKSYIGTPIFVNNKIYGTLSFASTELREQKFESHEKEIVELMAQSIGKFLAIHQTTTQRQQAEDALRESEERYRSLVEMSPEAIALYCEEKFVYINAAGSRLLGAKNPQELIGRSIWDVVHPDYVEVVKQRVRQVENLGQQSQLLEQKLIRLDGQARDVEIAGIPSTYQGKVATQIVMRDITDRKQDQEQLLYDAFHDTLTGLPNRSLFFDRLGQALLRSRQYPDYEFAVLFLDLDRFKAINDSLGHTYGDKLLIEIARRLNLCLRSSDTVARLGGDEFTILLQYPPDIDYASKVAEEIQQQLAVPFDLDGHQVFTTASIGIVHSRGYFPDKSRKNSACPLYISPEDLLRDADIAMYRAKALGKARHEVFDLTMHERTLSLWQLETELRQAIEVIKKDCTTTQCQFVLNYQPIVSLSSGRISGFEALVRWQHPTKGLISPGQFIPVAEETGLIVPLGSWVLRQACRQLTIWQGQSPNSPKPGGPVGSSADASLTMSVNLSGKQFSQPNLIEEIDLILEDTGCDRSHLKLEITESMIMENVALATKMLGQLKARNIKLSIDDFGTGYSSLSYLHRFPLDTLKIDRSFVNPLTGISDSDGHPSQPVQIVRAIVVLAHNLGLEVIAEGIETKEQLLTLMKLECEKGQGYFFSKPVDSEKATELLHDFHFPN
ncbi:MAG: PAS domain S-box protein [Cyanobacteriota bacterium]|nr:PAS domain S-box protein [Cyanobacteriota bacterium]